MNLQVNSPYKKCPYQCPFCVAAVNDEIVFSDDFYNNNRELYLQKLMQTIQKYKIEIQTHNYNYKGINGINVIAYSYNEIPKEQQEPSTKTIRATFIYTDKITVDDIIQFNLSSLWVNQVTVKQMVYNSYGNEKVNQYILEHRKELKGSEQYKLLVNGIRVDMDCHNSHNRYIIYRTDGYVYENWSTIVPLE